MKMVQTAFRISERDLERADKLTGFVSALHSGNASRSEVIRAALSRGLNSLEQAQDLKPEAK